MSSISSSKHWAEITPHSTFARRVLGLWPERCQQLLDQHRLESNGVIAPDINLSCSSEHFDKAIRAYRQTECLRIAWRDITETCTLQQALEDLCSLAEQTLQATIGYHTHRLTQRFGQFSPVDQEPAKFCIIGMGKLGGGELNFSSDIDILFIYSGSGKTSGPRRIDCADFYTRLAQAIVKSLDSVNAFGQAYRVDTRLRPYGSSGRLVWNAAAMEQYYVSEGRDWERYALLKARPIAGDKSLGITLLNDLQPFIYRRYLDYGLFDGVRQLRNDIARAAARRRHQDNLKLGPGGIREIEFLVQSLQILRGGQQPALRQNNLLHALALLEQHDLLEADVAQSLHTAYCFLRRLENRLQMLDDQQEHNIPNDPQQLEAWVALAGYADSQTLLLELNQIRQQVADRFDIWFGEDNNDTQPTSPRLESMADIKNWQALLTSALGEQDDALHAQFDASLKRILKQPISPSGRQRLQRLLSKMLDCTVKTPAPQKSLLHGLALLEKIACRSNYLSLLLEHPQALQRMLDYGARSDWIAQQLQHRPALLDELIDPVTLNSLPGSVEAYRQEAMSLLLQGHQQAEQQLSLVQQWRQSCHLRIAANELFQHLDTLAVQWHLSCLAEACLHAINAIAQSSVKAPVPLTIIAYGTLGASEMHYASDLDLVFLYPDGLSQPERSATRQAQKIIHFLTTIGPSSQLYEIDTRLRPNGQSGTLVSNITSFDEYQNNHAWVWEWQALSRARCVLAEPDIHQRFTEIRQRILQPARDPEITGDAIQEMFTRVKTQNKNNPLNLIRLQIQFLLQYWLLTHLLPDSPIPSNLIQQAHWLGDAFPSLVSDAALVTSQYQQLHMHLHQQELNRSNAPEPFCCEGVDKLWEKYIK